MKILSIACSKTGNALQEKTRKWFCEENENIEWTCAVKCRSLPEISISQGIGELVKENFDKMDAILFFTATGIAVRSIAGCLVHKSKDPAVIVVDETGRYCIPVLCGHMGGANELAGKLAEGMGATPVITTATDCEGKFAVDDFARKNNLIVLDWKLAKNVAACALEGKDIWLMSEIPLTGNSPEKVQIVDKIDGSAPECAKVVISHKKREWSGESVLQLVPKDVVAGIGCRKNIPVAKIEDAVRTALLEAGLLPEAVGLVVSIDRKKEEPGILEFCEKWNVEFQTYSAQELKEAGGNFASSKFVENVTGVDNVCERSAALAGNCIIYHKKSFDGVTVALAVREMRAGF